MTLTLRACTLETRILRAPLSRLCQLNAAVDKSRVEDKLERRHSVLSGALCLLTVKSHRPRESPLSDDISASSGGGVMRKQTHIARAKNDPRWKDKDLKISDEKTKSKKTIDKGKGSKITKHEEQVLQQDKEPKTKTETNVKSNLIGEILTKECHNELTSGEIVSLKILSRTMEVRSFIILGLGH
ncbi:hypothetical protein Tco_0952340 [Tanacetum coccineum]|uniref:Uncharacterized protein n=1 Tax=Tanacetum coccineum TaxID=301880 RepID=A0ABQ5DWP4_9ASTR